MTDIIDLGPATRRVAQLVAQISDDQLASPTPCPSYKLGDLLDHVSGFAKAFTAAATKSVDDFPEGGQLGHAEHLGDDWQRRIPAELNRLADAWRDPAAWSGMTKAGPVDLPGEIAGLVALNELLVHGWDLAAAAHLDYDVDEADAATCLRLAEQFAGSNVEAGPDVAFGPPRSAPDGASTLDRLIATCGREPAWSR